MARRRACGESRIQAALTEQGALASVPSESFV